MGGFKFVGEQGLLMELSGGIHSNTIIETKYHDPDWPMGLTAQILVGYQFKWRKGNRKRG